MFAIFIFVFTILSQSHAENITSLPSDQEDNYCLLPTYPEHGRYTISNNPSARPGQRYPNVMLDISCDPGYLIKNSNDSIFCVNGYWSGTLPTCNFLGFCTLPTDDLRVEYRCLSFPGTQECKSSMPSGAVVTPICRSPAYFSLRSLSKMHCRDGMWDYNPICKPAYGLTTQHRQLEGTSSNHLELPWHAVIYEQSSGPYYQICDGSLITATKIISSARWFHDHYDNVRPASDFKVAVNKMYLKYKDARDRNSQYSDVDKIIIPSSYRGDATNYEDNIAIVVVKRPFFFHLSVRPVCLDFDSDLDSTQLAEGNSGKTNYWRPVINNGDSSYVLNVVDFSYMKNEDCNTILSTFKRNYLTKDKFCARCNFETDRDETFGGGLVFLESTTQRYYLRGVRGDIMAVNNGVIYAFTSIMKHEHFIKEHL